MFDAKRLLDQLVGSGVAGGFAGGLAGSALANVMSGKKAKKLAGSALKMGGMAVVGGLAYKAWNDYQQKSATMSGTTTPAATSESAFLPDATNASETNALSLLLARAMISAAKADGQIDSQESQAILNQINGMGLDADDKAFLFEEYSKPLDIQALTQSVDTPEHAAEVYAASLLMLDPPSPPEQIYLDGLAQALNLEAGLVGEIKSTIQAAQAGA